MVVIIILFGVEMIGGRSARRSRGAIYARCCRPDPEAPAISQLQ